MCDRDPIMVPPLKAIIVVGYTTFGKSGSRYAIFTNETGIVIYLTNTNSYESILAVSDFNYTDRKGPYSSC